MIRLIYIFIVDLHYSIGTSSYEFQAPVKLYYSHGFSLLSRPWSLNPRLEKSLSTVIVIFVIQTDKIYIILIRVLEDWVI
jgi:hypothetical protein